MRKRAGTFTGIHLDAVDAAVVTVAVANAVANAVAAVAAVDDEDDEGGRSEVGLEVEG